MRLIGLSFLVFKFFFFTSEDRVVLRNRAALKSFDWFTHVDSSNWLQSGQIQLFKMGLEACVYFKNRRKISLRFFLNTLRVTWAAKQVSFCYTTANLYFVILVTSFHTNSDFSVAANEAYLFSKRLSSHFSAIRLWNLLIVKQLYLKLEPLSSPLRIVNYSWLLYVNFLNHIMK